MRTLMIYMGLPGSGKSTLAAQLVNREPKRWIRINRDSLREMVVGPGNNPHARNDAREDLVRSMKESLARQAFDAGYDVILDDTHLNGQTVKKLHSFAEAYGDVKVIQKGVNVDVKTCIERDAKRTGFSHVGADVITKMASFSKIDKGRKLSDKETYYAPRGEQGTAISWDPKLPEAIMVDLDGTLAIMGDRSPYDATDCDVKDLPNWPVINCVLAMHAQGVKVIFMSGRDHKYRPETIRFIEKYCRVLVGTLAGEQVIPYELHMRGELTPDKLDQRKDSIIKGELFDAFVRGKFNVRFVLDDRNQVVDFWRSIGLTCFQVNYGDF